MCPLELDVNVAQPWGKRFRSLNILVCVFTDIYIFITITSMHVKMRIYKVLLGIPKGKRPVGRSCHRWDDIRMDHKETEFQAVD
jgi:hypothetical protein